MSADNHRHSIPTLIDVPVGLEQAVWVERPLVEQGDSILAPLAWEELMCRQVGQGHPPVIHLWRHTDGMAIGLRDRRLTYATRAMEQFRQKGTSVCVRPSGGAAVPLHPGILNLSIILLILSAILVFIAIFALWRIGSVEQSIRGMHMLMWVRSKEHFVREIMM